jgi:hypothetical protein
MSEGKGHFNPAVAGWIDFGARCQIWPWLAVYFGGRVQRGVAGKGKEPVAPPATDWSEFGAGVRLDLAPFYLTMDGQIASYTNRLDEDAALLWGVAIGWRGLGPERVEAAGLPGAVSPVGR